MKEVYFDSNVYTHIFNRQYDITTPDIVRLKSNIERRKLKVYLSSVLLEETASAILRNEQEGLGRLRLIYSLARRSKVFTRYQDIIDGSIRSYATGEPLPDFLVPPPFDLRDVLKHQTPKTLVNLRELAQESQQIIETRTNDNIVLYEKLWPQAKEEKTQGQHQTFEEYWNEHSTYVIEKFSNYVGVLNECRERGLQGLLNQTILKTIAVLMLSPGFADSPQPVSIG